MCVRTKARTLRAWHEADDGLDLFPRGIISEQKIVQERRKKKTM
jgi:hypothetical protein